MFLAKIGQKFIIFDKGGFWNLFNLYLHVSSKHLNIPPFFQDYEL
jgi:hypothetical protein